MNVENAGTLTVCRGPALRMFDGACRRSLIPCSLLARTESFDCRTLRVSDESSVAGWVGQMIREPTCNVLHHAAARRDVAKRSRTARLRVTA